MIAYLDASILLRVVLGQPDALKEWPAIQQGVTRALTEVECLRTLDRPKIRASVPDDDIAARCDAVLRRAAQPMPTSFGTPDALHLATALLWREQTSNDLVLATHDVALGTAGRSVGHQVVGT